MDRTIWVTVEIYTHIRVESEVIVVSSSEYCCRGIRLVSDVKTERQSQTH